MTENLSGIVIRVVGPAESEDLAMLWSRWRAGRDADSDFEKRMAVWLAGEGERRTTWLASIEQAPVGVASLFEYRRMPHPDRRDSCWGYVGNMFVRDDVRNRGIGTALLETIIAVANDRGYARLVLSPAARSMPFYIRAGFTVPDVAGDQRLLVRPGGQ